MPVPPRPHPLLALALTGAAAGTLLLPALAGPASASAPLAGRVVQDTAEDQSTATALEDACGVRVTLRGTGPHDVVVGVQTAAPTTPAGQAAPLPEDGRWTARGGDSRDWVFSLRDAHSDDARGHRVEVAVTVDRGTPEKTLLWVEECAPGASSGSAASPSPSAAVPASPTASSSASPATGASGASPSPTASGSASPTPGSSGRPSAETSARPSASPVVSPSASASPTATTRPPSPSASPAAAATSSPAAAPAPPAAPPAAGATAPPSALPGAGGPAVPTSGTGTASAPVLLGGGALVAAPQVAPVPALAATGLAAPPVLSAPAVAAAPVPQVAAAAPQLFPVPAAASVEEDLRPAMALTTPTAPVGGALADLLPAGTALALSVLALSGLVRRRPVRRIQP